ncbi:cupin domain-containing protein [Falsiroseomonas stagni]|uniref:Cupin superfamily protein n=1 Tax=Falsiroseomonas stagni DSM 19981 TaxID=1123062 RepID=A0A1I3X637_9PROT|nr:cupin domain-containing protein [Falsiroseomonas stagni]SFK15030.1 Cupin superfamily protein [Falsiroseomonas stagni DSM 19981]
MAGMAEEAWALGFGDMSVEDGFALRESTDWRHFPASDPARYAPLLSIADLDAFLATDAARRPRISMADGNRQGGAGVPEDEYATADGAADLPRLFHAFDRGATLVISQFHELHPALGRFCRGLEQVFLHAVQANIYLTPPGAQGFRMHYDTHDVLVLQVQGEKHWRIWPGQPFPAPTRRTPWVGGVEPLAEAVEITMRPGDALYVPRGVLHDAAAQDGAAPSLHVTVGFMEPSFASVLRMAVDLLEEAEPALRAAFPTWRLADGPGALAPLAQPLAAMLAQPASLERTALALLDRLAMDRAPMLGRGLFPRMPGGTTRLRLAGGLLHALIPDEETGGAWLRWAGDPLALTPAEAGWIGALAEGTTPDALGDGALAFCHRLTRLGLLEEDGD